ncbi:hypothetical protein BDV97DRAFT_409673 [Delphinella strobiligena]|nr:hypothetical protein BDV97DRAFT_409673 [Delphinella strobiligena]
MFVGNAAPMIGLEPIYELEGDVPQTSCSSTSESLHSSSRGKHSDDDAAPAPIRTHARHAPDHVEDLAPVRDSLDEAVPPPFRIPRNISGSSGHGSKEDGSGGSNEDVRTWIYKPYANRTRDCGSSMASSVNTDENHDRFKSENTDSVGESESTEYTTATDHSVETGYNTAEDGAMTPRDSISEFEFPGRMGWIPPEPSVMVARQQRWSGTPRTTTNSSHSSGVHTGESSSPAHMGSIDSSNASSTWPLTKISTLLSTISESNKAAPPPIVKRTSVDQRSEHVNPWQGETMSDRGSISSGEWSSSEQYTSVLSVEKIHKLKKKGINPALYVEMKNARKGKSKWVNPLGGSSFLM